MSLNSASQSSNQDHNLSNFGLMLNPVRNTDGQGTSRDVSSLCSVGDTTQGPEVGSSTGLINQNRTSLLRHIRCGSHTFS